MPRCCAAPSQESDKKRRVLPALVRQQSGPQALVTRAQIPLLAADGVGVRATVASLAVGRAAVQRWRPRCSRVPARLVDAPRPGAPSSFTREQICEMLGLLATAARRLRANPLDTRRCGRSGRSPRPRRDYFARRHRARVAQGRSQAVQHARFDQHAARCQGRGDIPRCLRNVAKGARARPRRYPDALHRRAGPAPRPWNARPPRWRCAPIQSSVANVSASTMTCCP